MTVEQTLTIGSRVVYLGRHRVTVTGVRVDALGRTVYEVEGYDGGYFKHEVNADELSAPTKVQS